MLSGCLSVLSLCSVYDVDVLQPNGWMHQRATCYGGRPRRSPHCVRWGRSSFPKMGTAAPNLRPMYVVAKRLNGSRCHLLRRYAAAPATLLHGDPVPTKGRSPQFSATRLDGSRCHLVRKYTPRPR